MICKDCIKKDVCKHKEYLEKYPGLELSKCDYKKAGNTNSPASHILNNNLLVTTVQPKITREELNAKILEISKNK